jgi:hypothetical protein
MDIVKKLNDYVSEKLIEDVTNPYGSVATKLISDKEHVVSIGTSVLMTKFPELGGYPGGSFVQAVVDNDLEQAFSRADNTNKLAIEFYVKLIHNFSPNKL